MNKKRTMCLLIDGCAKAFFSREPENISYRPIYLYVIEEGTASKQVIKRLKIIFDWYNLGSALDRKGNGGVMFLEFEDETYRHPKTGMQLYKLNLELEFIDFLRSNGFGVKQIAQL